MTEEQKQIVIDKINDNSVKEVARLSGLNPSQVRWVMYKAGITKGSKAGRPGINKKRETASKDFFNINERSCWVSGFN